MMREVVVVTLLAVGSSVVIGLLMRSVATSWRGVDEARRRVQDQEITQMMAKPTPIEEAAQDIAHAVHNETMIVRKQLAPLKQSPDPLQDLIEAIHGKGH